MCGQYQYARLKWRFEKWDMSWLTAAPVGNYLGREVLLLVP